MLPNFRAPLKGLMWVTGEASLRPYPSTSLPPVSSSNRLLHLWRQRSRPADARLDAAEIHLRFFGGAVDRHVHRRNAVEDRRAIFLNRAHHLFHLETLNAHDGRPRPPRPTARPSSRRRCGKTASLPGIRLLRSVPANHAMTCMQLATRLRWLSMAPLEIPVVPPVYCKTARSVGLTGTGASIGWASFSNRTPAVEAVAYEGRVIRPTALIKQSTSDRAGELPATT